MHTEYLGPLWDMCGGSAGVCGYVGVSGASRVRLIGARLVGNMVACEFVRLLECLRECGQIKQLKSH